MEFFHPKIFLRVSKKRREIFDGKKDAINYIDSQSEQRLLNLH